MKMNRRTFLITTGSVGTLALAGAATWKLLPSNSADLSVNSLINRLNAIQQLPNMIDSTWNAFQVFTHMAQSVEYSMEGYPVHKSDLFKSTVGKAAFSAFSSKGYMSHNLEEAIPGAPLLQVEGDARDALNRLIESLVKFQNYHGDLEDHFAYGPLTKEQYAIAHVLHVNDHFTQLT